MPWNVVLPAGAVVLLAAAWLFRRRRPPSTLDALPDVGQPSPDAQPMVELRMQDIGSGSYELPFPDPNVEPEPDPDLGRSPD
jgi:hypothetical protein